MGLLEVLLLVVAFVSFIAGAIILTPFGIIILAAGIYSWKNLYPILSRIARWSAQRRNLVPLILPEIILGLFFLILGVVIAGASRFSGLSILIFIWFLFLWLAMFGLAALPFSLAIVVWGVEQVQWLWPWYQKRFLQAVPLIGEGSGPSLSNISKVQTDRTSKHAGGSKPGKKPKDGATFVQGKSGSGDTTLKSDADTRQKPPEVSKPDSKPEEGATYVQGKSGSGDAISEGDTDNGPKPSKIVIQDKKYKKGTAARKKPKAGGNSMITRVLIMLRIIEKKEPAVSKSQQVQTDSASKHAGLSGQDKKKKKPKKSSSGGTSQPGDADNRQKPPEVSKPDRKPEEGTNSVQKKSSSGGTLQPGDADNGPKPSKIVIQDKKYKKGTDARKKPKAGGNSMITRVLTMLRIIEKKEPAVSKSQQVQTDRASKHAGLSGQDKKKKKPKKDTTSVQKKSSSGGTSQPGDADNR